jgi:hypothetical protein
VRASTVATSRSTASFKTSRRKSGSTVGLYRTLAALETEGHLTRTDAGILLKKSDAV